jgi:hypothetical protein
MSCETPRSSASSLIRSDTRLLSAHQGARKGEEPGLQPHRFYYLFLALFLLWGGVYTARAQENPRAPPPRAGARLYFYPILGDENAIISRAFCNWVPLPRPLASEHNRAALSPAFLRSCETATAPVVPEIKTLCRSEQYKAVVACFVQQYDLGFFIHRNRLASGCCRASGQRAKSDSVLLAIWECAVCSFWLLTSDASPSRHHVSQHSKAMSSSL